MERLKQIFDWVIKNWGYEYLLVAAGACLGLLLVVIIGFDGGPGRPPGTPEIAPSPRPPVASPSRTPPQPVETAKPSLEEQPNLAASPPDQSAPPAPASKAPPWQRFAAVHGPILGRPMIALLIDDMGVDRTRTAGAIDLPGPLTMSFLTYARSIKAQAAAARDAGHEIMIHVPMEADDASAYPGPKALKRGLSQKEMLRRINWALGRLDHYVGINNHMGSRFTAHQTGMELVLAEVKRRGLYFVDSRTSPKTVGRQVARRLSVPFVGRDIFLDDDPSRAAISRQLKFLETIASEKGYAVAIGHPYESTVRELAAWLPTLAVRGFVLVPASAIVRHRLEEERR